MSVSEVARATYPEDFETEEEAAILIRARGRLGRLRDLGLVERIPGPDKRRWRLPSGAA